MPADAIKPSDVMRIHFVCTGNICRSPFCELALKSALDETHRFEISSSGVFVLESRPISQGMRPLIKERLGMATGEHRSKQTDGAALKEQDLIIAMTRDHRMAILEEHPALVNRVFTLLELPRLIDALAEQQKLEPSVVSQFDSSSAKLRAQARTLSHARSLAEKPQDLSQDDVIDPYGQADDQYEISVQQMMPALATIEKFLRALI
jgi:protein-tyrosine phosphatase